MDGPGTTSSAASTATAGLRLSPTQVAVLRCPTCRGALDHDAAAFTCADGHRWPIVQGVPVFTEVGLDVEVRPLDHVSHQPPQHLVPLVQSSAQPWLQLGAGASAVELPNAIELETAIFRHTHVVGDVHHLPFADGSLGGAIALNVFEHLSDPDTAARELRRCLVPGAKVVIQTAFLQPLHADPYHFYNATETGIRRWFEQFDIDAVTVPWNFNPVFTFSWLASDLLWGATPAQQHVLGKASLHELSNFWRDPATRHGKLWDTFLQLPEHTQRVLAAGFEMIATRPADQGGAAS